MRPLLVALSFLLAAPAVADSAQADDDEKPGERAGSKRNGDTPTDTDTPPTTNETDDEAPPPVTRTTKKLSRGKPGGDSPINLTNKGPANAEGAYAGVSIGGEGLPPHPPKLPLRGPQRMTWPGFQVRDGVPTVFLQTTGTPDYAVSASPGAILVTLRGTKIQLRNNRRPLKVAEFGTAITEITAAPRGHDVVVTIKHKGEASHRERVEPSAGGFQMLVVELPGNK